MNGRYEGEISFSPKAWECKPNGHGKVTAYQQVTDDQQDKVVSWTYEGAFVDGRITGKGTWYYPDGAVQYDGCNQNGDYHGQGTSYRQDGNTREDGTREDGTMEYEGIWQESCWRGNGTLYRPDGSISRNGEWVNGGSEEYKWQGETCWYEGDWDEEGYPHGWGILYRPDCIIVEGCWQNGEPVDGPPPGYPDAP